MTNCSFAFFALAAMPAAEPDRVAIRAKMERAMGAFPTVEHRVPLDVKVVSVESIEG